MRGGCALKYFFQALQHVPSQNCPMSFPITMLTLGSWRACGVWRADSPQATEVLNHHVFALLKFHSAWAEIWSVKKTAVSLLPVAFLREILEGGQSQLNAKIPWQKSRGRAVQRRQWEQTVPGTLGAAGASTVLAGRGERSSSTTCSALAARSYGSFFFSLSPKVKSWDRSSQAVGEKESTAVAQRQGKAARGSRNQEKFVLPTSSVGVWSTGLLSLCTASPHFHWKRSWRHSWKRY